MSVLEPGGKLDGEKLDQLAERAARRLKAAENLEDYHFSGEELAEQYSKNLDPRIKERLPEAIDEVLEEPVDWYGEDSEIKSFLETYSELERYDVGASSITVGP